MTAIPDPAPTVPTVGIQQRVDVSMADSGERAQSAFSTTRMVAAQGLPSGRACTALTDGVGIVLNREDGR